MGYWIHVEDLPTGGGGGGDGGWKGCLGCFGFLAAAFALWSYLGQPGALQDLFRRSLNFVIILLLAGSVLIIIKVIAEVGFDKEVLIPGLIGLGAGFLLGLVTVAGAGGGMSAILIPSLMTGVIVAAPAMLFGAAGFEPGGVIAGIAGFGAGFFLGNWAGGNSFNIGIILAAVAIDLYFCWGELFS